MKISIVNVNLDGLDAVGGIILQTARHFMQREAEVGIFLQAPPQNVPMEILKLCRVVTLDRLLKSGLSDDDAGTTFFHASDLIVYNYPAYFELLEAIHCPTVAAVLLMYHCVTPPELWGSSPGAKSLNQDQRQVALARFADLVAVASDYGASEITRAGGVDSNRVRILPPAISSDVLQPGPKPRELIDQWKSEGAKIVLFVGRVSGNKGIDTLVRALPLVLNEVPNLKLLIVGDHSSLPAYRQVADDILELAGQLGVRTQVVFTGVVPEVAPYYRLADVFVTASRHEGFCLPVIEAMASGLPVICSNAAALPSTAGEAALFCAVDDAAAFAAKIVLAVNCDTIRTDLIQRGLSRAGEFTEERFKKRLQEIVDEVLLISSQRRGITAVPSSICEPESDWEDLVQLGRLPVSDFQWRSFKPVLGPLLAWFRKSVTEQLRLNHLDPLLNRQVAFNQRAVGAIKRMDGRLSKNSEVLKGELSRSEERLRGALFQAEASLAAESLQTSAALAELAGQISALRGTLAEQTALLEDLGSRMERRLGAAEIKLADFREYLESTRSEMSRLCARLSSKSVAVDSVPICTEILSVSGNVQAAMTETFGKSEQSKTAAVAPPVSTLAQQTAVGGELEVVRKLHRQFVPVFRECRDILDVACGRGIFLELLRDAGIPAWGVDLDADSVSFCRASGLDAVTGEAIAYLSTLRPASLGGIFCAHFVEHLGRQELLKCFSLFRDKLQPGGPLVVVTPNGAGLTIFHYTFFKDFTHVNPLHPDALRFLFEAHGFEVTEVGFQSQVNPASKLEPLAVELSSQEGIDEFHRATFAAIDRNIAKLNNLLFGDLDTYVIGRR